jgi:uncharacterized protein
MGNSLFQKVAIGTAQFGLDYGIANKNGQVDLEEVGRILNYAKKYGINSIDTAKAYGNSEKNIGKYINACSSKDWAIVTKIGKGQQGLKSKIRDSIEKLKIIPHTILAHSVSDYLDIPFCDELHQLKDMLGIQKVGVSTYTVDDINEVLSAKIPDVIQCPLNILDTKLYRNGILDEIKGHGIEIHIRSVFLQGLFYLSDEELKKKFPDVISAIKKLLFISNNAGVTLPELSLLWVLSLDQVDKVIIGVDSVKQLKIHINSIGKKVYIKSIDEACGLEYENENVLNPLLWGNNIIGTSNNKDFNQ